MPDDLLIEWGMRLKQARQERGLRVVDVADQAHIGRQYLYRLEAGEKSPSDAVRIRLATALGVPVADLFPYEVAS